MKNIKTLFLGTIISFFIYFLVDFFYLKTEDSKKFNKSEWIENKNFTRLKMYDDLNKILIGKSEEEVLLLLGDPDDSNSNTYYKLKNYTYTLNSGSNCGYGDHLAIVIVFDDFSKVKIIDKECI